MQLFGNVPVLAPLYALICGYVLTYSVSRVRYPLSLFVFLTIEWAP